MLSPRVHGLDHFRALSRATGRHDWRMPEVGLVFRVGKHTYQTVEILPVCRAIGRDNALVRFVELGRRVVPPTVMTVMGYWSMLDNRAAGLNLHNLAVVKSHARHARKVARERARVRRFLVVAGLVVEGGAA